MSRTLRFPLAAALVILLPIGSAIAQPGSADFNYCANLIALYDRYVGPNDGDDPNRVRPSAEAGYAKSRCMAGDTATGIPILERRLAEARIDLPTR